MDALQEFQVPILKLVTDSQREELRVFPASHHGHSRHLERNAPHSKVASAAEMGSEPERDAFRPQILMWWNCKSRMRCVVISHRISIKVQIMTFI